MNLQATRKIDQGPPPSDNAGLLGRLKRREPEAQKCLLRAETAGLHATAVSILDSKEDAIPLVADVFTDFFYSYVDSLEHERAISAYLRIMVVRRARRLLLRRSREVDVELCCLADTDGRDVIESVENKTWLPWLEDCLSLLTERARKILKLHFGHDLRTVEIASQIGVTKQAVSKTILKCINQLRRCLERKRKGAERGHW